MREYQRLGGAVPRPQMPSPVLTASENGRMGSPRPPTHAYSTTVEEELEEAYYQTQQQRHYPPQPPYPPDSAMPLQQMRHPSETGGLGRACHFELPMESQPPSPGAKDRGWMERQQCALPGPGLMRYPTKVVKPKKRGVFINEYPVASAIKDSIERKWLVPSLAEQSSAMFNSASTVPIMKDLSNLSKIESTEFTHMRYTAATCDPYEFLEQNGYSLRVSEYKRPTEILIAITYYNEDIILTARTLYGVMKNVRDICNMKKSKFWNKDIPAWKKIVICLVFDGIDPADPQVLDFLSTIGCYQDGVMKRSIDGKETVCHIFEYTSQVTVTPDQKLVQPGKDGSGVGQPTSSIHICVKAEEFQEDQLASMALHRICSYAKS